MCALPWKPWTSCWWPVTVRASTCLWRVFSRWCASCWSPTNPVCRSWELTLWVFEGIFVLDIWISYFVVYSLYNDNKSFPFKEREDMLFLLCWPITDITMLDSPVKVPLYLMIRWVLGRQWFIQVKSSYNMMHCVGFTIFSWFSFFFNMRFKQKSVNIGIQSPYYKILILISSL